MHLRKKWNKGQEISISTPENIVHTGHGSHDEITQRLQGLPEEWVTILRENGVIGEDLVLPKKSKTGGLYGNGIFNLSSSSLLSNRSFQKLWRGMSGKRKSGSEAVDESSDALEAVKAIPGENATVDQGPLPSPLLDSSASPLDLTSSDLQSPISTRQSTFKVYSQHPDDIDQLAKDCGLPFRHHDYNDINHSLLQVVDSLGHGSLGVVEEVRVSPQRQSFVRKRVQIPYYKRKQYLKIISQEAQALQNLSHCHIVKMIGSYSEVPDTGRQFYSLLMAPVGQRDLKTFLDMVGDRSTVQGADWIADRKTWLRNWFKCLSSALAYIHSKGVRHQDIKPSNIIHRRSAIYFTDFSSASQFQIGQTTSTENPARTSVMYAAPEVVDNDDSLNRHGRGTDVFALGAVFTDMLAILRGKSIEEYHQFLLNGPGKDTKEGGSTPAGRQSFLYGRKTTEIDAFFRDDEFYQTCVRSMLIADREQRPDAQQVATHIRGFEPWSLRGCACDLEDIG
ncbi:kinase-like domain-containing protein [Lophiotrema nucula]|uniref:Kinase-like domain-containing protein n=1 Tax=Lophiotrema nucula TaxID=690887 RepID=A0A6A5ZL54_9PLEO|nr:kinase-like domain-containing protein [Lophiotrema nucula]